MAHSFAKSSLSWHIIPPQLKIHHNSKPIIWEIEFIKWSSTVQYLTFILLKYRHRFHFSITFSPLFQSPQTWHFTMETWYFAWIGCVIAHILIQVKKRVLLNDEWCKTKMIPKGADFGKNPVNAEIKKFCGIKT